MAGLVQYAAPFYSLGKLRGTERYTICQLPLTGRPNIYLGESLVPRAMIHQDVYQLVLWRDDVEATAEVVLTSSFTMAPRLLMAVLSSVLISTREEAYVAIAR